MPPTILIDVDHAIIVDVEASRAIRQAEVGAARTMVDRTRDRFGLYPERLAADSAYGWSMSAGSSLTSRSSTDPSAATAPSRRRTSPTTTRPTPTSVRPGSHSGRARSSIGRRARSSTRTA